MNNKFPCVSVAVFLLIVAGCLCADLIVPYAPEYMNLTEMLHPPSAAHLFGTDSLGRDIFAGIWHGGRISLAVGLMAAFLSALIAILYGCAAGLLGKFTDTVLMRACEALMSIPQIFVVIFIQAILGNATVFSMSVAIGVTGWMQTAKVVRSEVRQIAGADYVLAARMMGGGLLYTIRNHLLPNILPAIMFMLISNIGTAIATEATLSYLGIGFPMETITWGSLLALSEQAFLTDAWWLVFIPGVFLVLTLVCIVDVGEYLRTEQKKNHIKGRLQ